MKHFQENEDLHTRLCESFEHNKKLENQLAKTKLQFQDEIEGLDFKIHLEKSSDFKEQHFSYTDSIKSISFYYWHAKRVKSKVILSHSREGVFKILF